jgi:hypothetical protein
MGVDDPPFSAQVEANLRSGTANYGREPGIESSKIFLDSLAINSHAVPLIQKAPLPRSTTKTVFNKICKSSKIE